MVILSRLFGSELRVKMMRLFLFNPDRAFDIDCLAEKTGARPAGIKREAAGFRRIGLIKPAKVLKLTAVKKGKKVVEKKKRVPGLVLDQKFKYVRALTDFFVKTHSLENRAIVRRIEKAGRIKAVVIAGIFIGDQDSRLDLFVVGDNVKSSFLDRVVRGIESDMGKDIRYAVLSSPDYAYRVSMNDKLIRDVLDYPHTILLDKIGISSR
ncbi:MAG: hypothetical protein KGI79_01860 [Patescibacteria group bacterium]|nr:hypothetical protein [Patescibacteria group bacterium]MDE2116597.1 hypothetical protein [Patescibacteria group bacterium]